MKDGTTIAWSLHRIAVEQDFQETLLDEEKCTHCGRELASQYSRKTHCCGACSRKGMNGRPTTGERAKRKKAKADKHGWDYDFNKGHGDKFIAAFDRAFNLKPVIIEQGGQSTKSERQCVPARLQSLEVKYDTTNKHTSTEHPIITARSGNTAEVVLGKAGESRINFPNQPYSVARSITAGFELADRGSNPLRAIPARLFWIPLQDIGGHYPSIPTTHSPPVPAKQKHAGIFSPIEGFSSCVLPPIQQILACDLLRAPDLHIIESLQLFPSSPRSGVT